MKESFGKTLSKLVDFGFNFIRWVKGFEVVIARLSGKLGFRS